MQLGTRKSIEIEFENDDEEICIRNNSERSLYINDILTDLEDARSMFDNHENPVYSDCIEFLQDLELKGYTDIILPS